MEFQNHVTAETIKLHEARQKNVRNGYAPMYTQKQVQRTIDAHYSLLAGIAADEIGIEDQRRAILRDLRHMIIVLNYDTAESIKQYKQKLADRRKVLAYMLDHKRRLEYAVSKVWS